MGRENTVTLRLELTPPAPSQRVGLGATRVDTNQNLPESNDDRQSKRQQDEDGDGDIALCHTFPSAASGTLWHPAWAFGKRTSKLNKT